MELYVTVSFWLGVCALVLHIINLVNHTGIRELQYTIGEDVVLFMLTIVFLVWSGILVFGV